jgi:hypothetical protein
VPSGSLFKYRHSPGLAVVDGSAFASWLCAGSVPTAMANRIKMKELREFDCDRTMVSVRFG